MDNPPIQILSDITISSQYSMQSLASCCRSKEEPAMGRGGVKSHRMFQLCKKLILRLQLKNCVVLEDVDKWISGHIDLILKIATRGGLYWIKHFHNWTHALPSAWVPDTCPSIATVHWTSFLPSPDRHVSNHHSHVLNICSTTTPIHHTHFIKTSPVNLSHHYPNELDTCPAITLCTKHLSHHNPMYQTPVPSSLPCTRHLFHHHPHVPDTCPTITHTYQTLVPPSPPST